MSKEELEQIDSKKLRGGYYTPKQITDFICRWAISEPNLKVLEPSCGDGNFIESAINRFIELGVTEDKLYGLIKGVELIESEAEKSKIRAAKFGLNSNTIINSDFFKYISNANGEAHYDIVIGNPPFIRYQNFPEEHRTKAFKMMEEMGLKPNKLTNIWAPFLVISANALQKNGKLGMVIPAELFQVKYAAETRVFLSNFFSRITIITFKKLVFDDIQQEIVLLLCEKDVLENQGIRVVELNTLDELRELNLPEIQQLPVKSLDHDTEKWTKYFLEEEEIQLLRNIKTNKKTKVCGDIMHVDVGIVTGRNEFFMINKSTVAEWNLKPFTQKVVSRSNHFRGIIFDDDSITSNINEDIDCFLFIPPNKPYEDLPEDCQKYIKYGEKKGYHEGYKCKIRKRWYITPSLWVPDAFVLRQVGDYPKIIINSVDASSTDTIHRVRLKPHIDKELVALSFLNSLTFAFSEITGRSYGGGVLTFEPTEIEEIPLPLLKNSNIEIRKIDSLIRKREIEKVLDIVDEELLIKQLKFSHSEVNMLRNIWKKLSNRRQKRKTK